MISLWSTFKRSFFPFSLELTKWLAKVNIDIPEVRILDLPVVHLREILLSILLKLTKWLAKVNINIPEVGILDLPVVHLRVVLLAILF